MSFLNRSDIEVVRQDEVGSIISKVTDDKLEEKLEEKEKEENDTNFVLKDVVAANKSIEYR